MSDTRFFLNPHSIRALVPEPTFDRGMSLYLIQQVLSCEVNHVNSTEWEIEGLVQGTLKTPYSVTATVEIDPTGNLSFFNSDCSCPVGDQCKHGVALALKAAFKSIRREGTNLSPNASKRGLQPADASAPSAEEIATRLQARERSMAEREAQQAHQKVTQWLDLFGQLPAPLDATGLDGESSEEARKTEQLVFVLTTSIAANQQFLHVGYGVVTKLRNGSWSKVKTPRYGDVKHATAQDLEVISLLRTMGGHGMSYSYAVVDSAQLSGETGRLVMQMAARSARLYDQSEARTLEHPLRVGPPRALAWSWAEVKIPGSHEPGWALQARLEGDGGPTWFANSPPWYLDSKLGECGLIEVPGLSAQHLALLLKAPPIPHSDFATHETALLSRLVGLPLPPVLKAPRVIQGITPQAILEIEPVPLKQRAQAGLLRATLRFDYDGLGIFSRNSQTPVFVERSLEGGKIRERVMLHRDVVRERSALSKLHEFGLVGDVDGVFHIALAQEHYRWLQWSESEFAPLRDAGFIVVLAPELDGWIERADSLDVSMNEPQGGDEGGDTGDVGSSQSPWFDLSLGMQINGQRHNILPFLPELLNQLGNFITEDGHIAQLPPFAYLAQPNGKLLRLPTEPLLPWLNALLDLLGERGHDVTGTTLRLSRMEALRLGAALGAGVQWQGAQALRAMVKQLAGQSALPDVALPKGLNAELRAYQQQGLNWLQFLRSHGLAGILADDMGLGKTLQTLAHVLVEKQAGRLDRPALVIAPVSLMGNWKREANRFTPGLKVLVLHGAERHEAATDMATHDLIIAPYSLLKRDRERWMKQAWHLVVLDEAQNIKNANTDAAQVVAELNTRHRLCLSGTPMENHLGELWSLFHFLMPGFLGSQARFKALFRTPIEKLGSSERLNQLRKRVTPFMLRRAKSDVATDLPPKQTAVSTVELTGKQADLYETIRLTTEKAVREALANKGLAKSQIQILDALLKLRQVCCDPRLVPLPAAKKIKESAKLELLMALLPEMLAEGRRILLFSQFTSMLELIEEELRKRKLSWVKLTGQSQKRDALIEQFTSGQVPLFLISLKAGGVGLNLPQADTVIHYDPWWNPAVENQATDRAHRIGQTQSVFVYKLVAQGTIEERILALQERKAALADSIYSGSQGRKQPLFTEDDVAELLKPLSVR